MQLQSSSSATQLDRLSDLSLDDTGTTNNSASGLPTPPSSEDERLSTRNRQLDSRNIQTNTITGTGTGVDQDLRHIFAIGDCAETGAIQAGHTAYWQAEVAARNICRLIERKEGRLKESLESYKPGLPCIKLTLGLVS